MEILIHERPQIVSGDYSMHFHPFGTCDGSLESSNPTLFNHMGTSHFNTSYSIRSCSFLSKMFTLILTGSIASKGITFIILKSKSTLNAPLVYLQIHGEFSNLSSHLSIHRINALVLCLCKLHNFGIDNGNVSPPKRYVHDRLTLMDFMQSRVQDDDPDDNSGDVIPIGLLGGGEHFEDVAGGRREATRTVQRHINGSNTDCPQNHHAGSCHISRHPLPHAI